MNNDHTYAFEKLRVWQNAKDLVIKIYKLTKNFPDDEKFGLTTQIRRAAISVSANIAEGSGRKSSKDQAHFYQISYSSLLELLNHLYISVELGFIEPNLFKELKSQIFEITNQLNALHHSIKI